MQYGWSMKAAHLFDQIQYCYVQIELWPLRI